MGRTVAVIWHASFSLAAGVLYFFFVLPRTLELTEQTSPGLGTGMRIVTGALIGLAALPVVFTLLRTRKPEFGTPALALNLRTTSIVLHVLAGTLIVGTAISEIWLSLNTAGQWLFGIYGAAGAIALLGVLSFALAFVAELPPPPPKPVKVKQRTSRDASTKDKADLGGDDSGTEDANTDDSGTEDSSTEDSDVEDSESAETEDSAEVTAEGETEDTAKDAAEDTETDQASDDDQEVTAESDTTPETGTESDSADSDTKLQNRRPSGKGTLLGRRKKTRGSVAVED